MGTVILVLLVVVATVQSLKKSVRRVNSKHPAKANLERKFSKNVNRNAIKQLAKQNVETQVSRKKNGQNKVSRKKPVQKKDGARKNTERQGKLEKKGKLASRKGSNPQLQSRQESICIGSVSVDSSCMTSLKASMKFDRDKITNFKNQLERAENFDKIIGKKVAKNSDFSNSTTYLLIALGSNMSSPNCSGPFLHSCSYRNLQHASQLLCLC